MSDSLAAGLYLVATPIGSARDITLRALDILRDADAIAAEDTRTIRKLMEIHGVPLRDRPLIAYHDHSGPKARTRILDLVAGGAAVAYASEAGTPLVADPGYQLARAAIEADLPMTAAPGPSAALAALTLSGLPTDRFLFAGFPPHGGAGRRGFLTDLAPVAATLVLFESPRRAAATLGEMAEIMGARQAVLCRELTKRFEEAWRGTLPELAARAAEAAPRGEVVLVVDRDRSETGEADMETALRDALETMSVKDAADAVSGALGLPRRRVYQAALDLAKDR